jgi:stearoyl-CoA desaturase (delta-9 desaturase)
MDAVSLAERNANRARWLDSLPFWGVHVAALVGAIWVGWSTRAAVWLGVSYAVRMFAITAGYHRYFAHRSYSTSRAFQFVLALLGMTTAQQGALWWAGHHRRHHRHSDQVQDVHSPRQRGFIWSHVMWIFARRHEKTEYGQMRDFARYPELRFLDDHDQAFVIATGVLTFLVGGSTALVWGFFVSIVAAWHITFCINSLAHVWGTRRYGTDDDSRNNPLLAVLTLGEGWHNNHHHYQRSARQGHRWWELDVSYYVLKLLELVHLVRDVQGVPRHVRDGVEAPGRARLATAKAA